jgi:polar amino acid transport system substrate-binding protein
VLRCSVLLAWGISPPASAEELQLTTLDWPPYSGAIAQQGFLSVVLRQAYAHSGHTVQVQVYPWNRAVKTATSGGDTVLGFYSASRAECSAAKGITSDPIGYYQFGLAQRKGSGPQWQSTKDLAGKRMGVVEGYDNGPELTALMESKAVQVDVATNDLANLRKVLAQRVDYASVDTQVFNYLQREHALHGLELAKQTTTPRLPLYVCFNTSPRAQAMLQALNAGLKKVDINAVAQTYVRTNAAGKRP